MQQKLQLKRMESYQTTLGIKPIYVLQRGLLAYRPKNLMLDKLVNSAFNKVSSQLLANQYNTYFASDVESFVGKIAHEPFPFEVMVSFKNCQLVKFLCKIPDPYVFVVFEESSVKYNSLLDRFAQSILVIKPDIEHILFNQINAIVDKHFEKFFPQESKITVQYKNGKSQAIDVINHSISRIVKIKSTQAFNKDVLSNKIQPGWGVCAFAIRHYESESQFLQRRDIFFSSWLVSDAYISLAVLVEIILSCFEVACSETQIEKIDALSIIAPNWLLNSYLIDRFILDKASKRILQDAQIKYDDLLFGWSPDLTYAETICSYNQNTMLIDISSFPYISICLAHDR